MDAISQTFRSPGALSLPSVSLPLPTSSKISVPVPAVIDPLAAKMIPALISNLVKIKENLKFFYFLKFDDFCEVILIDCFINYLNLSRDRASERSQVRLFENFAEMIVTKSWKGKKSTIYSVFPQESNNSDYKTHLFPLIKIIRVLANYENISTVVEKLVDCPSIGSEEKMKGIVEILSLQEKLFNCLNPALKGPEAYLKRWLESSNSAAKLCNEIQMDNEPVELLKKEIIGTLAVFGSKKNFICNLKSEMSLASERHVSLQSLEFFVDQLEKSKYYSNMKCNSMTEAISDIKDMFYSEYGLKDTPAVRKAYFIRGKGHNKIIFSLMRKILLAFSSADDFNFLENNKNKNLLLSLNEFIAKEESNLSSLALRKKKKSKIGLGSNVSQLQKKLNPLILDAIQDVIEYRHTLKDLFRFIVIDFDVYDKSSVNLFFSSIKSEIDKCLALFSEKTKKQSIAENLKIMNECIDLVEKKYFNPSEEEMEKEFQEFLLVSRLHKYFMIPIVQEVIKEYDEMQNLVFSIKNCFSLLFDPFISFFEQKDFLPNYADLDFGALWIQSLETEKKIPYRKQAQAMPPALKNDQQEACFSLENDEKIFQEKVEPIISKSPFSLSHSLLPTSLTNFSGKTSPERILTCDLGYHMEMMQNSWEMMEKLVESKNLPQLSSLLPVFLNHFYHAHERAMMPAYLSSTQNQDQKLRHGLVHISQQLNAESEKVSGLDKMTIWYRYPHFSLELHPHFQAATPVGLHLTACPSGSAENFSSFALLVKESLDSLMEHIQDHRSFPESRLANVRETFVEKIESLEKSVSGMLLPMESQESAHSQVMKKNLERLERCLTRLKGEQEQLKSTSASLTQATIKDLMVHIERFSRSLMLLEKFPEQKYLGSHCHMILMSGQYIVELALTVHAINNHIELRTHRLSDYFKIFDLSQIYSQKFVEDYLDLRKACDYPFKTFEQKKGIVNPGMKLLEKSFFVARSGEVGEGFLSKKMPRNAVVDVKKELMGVVGGILSFLEKLTFSDI